MTSIPEPSPESHLFSLLGQQTTITVATAESLTAGGVCARIARPAGASAYLLGGINAYADTVKRDILGVAQDILDNPGAVSETCARAMAEGTRSRLHATFGVSTTGIAGPTGATARKPIGLVYIAVAGPDGTTCEEHVFPGDRAAITNASIDRALDMLLDRVRAFQTSTFDRYRREDNR